MVFHDIESVTDVLSGHRIIIYYIQGKDMDTCNDRLIRVVETALGILEKKNDDLLIIKVNFESHQFYQFQELYSAEVTGVITLFVINSEGIPLICEQINEEDNISYAISSISTMCQLNYNPITVAKLDRPSEHLSEKNSTNRSENHQSKISASSLSNTQEIIVNEDLHETRSSSDTTIESNQPLFTELQICLPNGSREKLRFLKDAMLQEVWILISTKYKLKDFDLKTYYRPAFSEEEYEKTLNYLGLYPNGVIIVVIKSVLPFNNNGGIGGLVQYSYHLVINKTGSVLRYIQGLLFMFWNSFFSGRPNSDNSRSQRQSRGGNSHSEQSSSRGVAKKSSRIFGNIHTLSRNDDSDDENNRYNGNSTQQK